MGRITLIILAIFALFIAFVAYTLTLDTINPQEDQCTTDGRTSLSLRVNRV